MKHDIGLWVCGIIFLLACIYVLFFWDDPAIRRFEEGMKREQEKVKNKEEEP